MYVGQIAYLQMASCEKPSVKDSSKTCCLGAESHEPKPESRFPDSPRLACKDSTSRSGVPTGL